MAIDGLGAQSRCADGVGPYPGRNRASMPNLGPSAGYSLACHCTLRYCKIYIDPTLWRTPSPGLQIKGEQMAGNPNCAMVLGLAALEARTGRWSLQKVEESSNAEGIEIG